MGILPECSLAVEAQSLGAISETQHVKRNKLE